MIDILKQVQRMSCFMVFVSGLGLFGGLGMSEGGHCSFSMAGVQAEETGRILLAQSQAPKFNRVDPELLQDISDDANFPPELIEALNQEGANPSEEVVDLQAMPEQDQNSALPDPARLGSGVEVDSEIEPSNALVLPQAAVPAMPLEEGIAPVAVSDSQGLQGQDSIPVEYSTVSFGMQLVPNKLVNGMTDVKIDHLELKDMEIVDVLKLIAQKTGLNIIAGKGVQGKVTIYLNDVSATEALRIILDVNNLAYRYEDGIVRVMAAQDYEHRYGQVFGGKVQTRVYHLNYAKAEDVAPLIEHLKSSTGKIISDLKSNTVVVMDTEERADLIESLIREIDTPVQVAVFELNYAKAEELVAKIEPLITQSIGSIRFDARSNKLIVSDKPSKMGAIAQLIKEFDVQDRQVLIEAKIVQIQLSDSYELGVDWEAVFPSLDDLTAQADFNVLSNSEANFGKIQIGTIATNNYTAMLEALQSVGKTNILSSPSITVVNNQEARILVGTTQPYVTTTTTTPASGPTTVSESVNFIEVGVKLYVVPTIHSDGFITMKIKPEVSTTLTPITTSQNNEIPVVETSEAETIVRIKDGVTIVIGGLIKDEKRSTIKKVPFLGSIPFLGTFFQNTDDSTVKTEIAIFLTPRVVVGDQKEQHSFITADNE